MWNKIVALAMGFLLSFTFAAYEDVLIDFNKLSTYKDSDNEKKEMLYNENWRATLNSSADFVLNRKLTYCKDVPVKGTESKELFVDGATDGQVLGVRVNFPSSDYNAYAVVKPMFEIESYAGEDGNLFVGDGLLKNVGTVKKVTAYIKGKNFPHGFYIKMKDHNDIITSYFMGYLDFDGWAPREWENPMYLENIRDRELIRAPLYPRVEPLVKLDSFIFFRDGATVSGDFICYLGWVKVEYDKGIISREEDIDDEEVWGIMKAMSDVKAKAEAERLGARRELEELEAKKMAEQMNQAGGGTTQPAPTGP